MRLILGSPTSTRIANMQTELNLPPLIERIYANVTCLSVRCLSSPHLAPHFSHILRASLQPDAPRHHLRPGARILITTVSSILRRHINVPVAEVDHGPPPWKLPRPRIWFTPTSKSDLPLLQRQLALESIANMSSEVPAAHHLYVDGSLQADGSAGYALYSPTMKPPEGGWVGHRLPDSSSSTYCELHGILKAVDVLNQRQLNGIVICDSQSALLAISSPQPSYCSVVQQIQRQLIAAEENSIVVKFIWIPSHVGLAHNDTVDLIAKNACSLPPPPDDATPSLNCYKKTIHSASLLPTMSRTNAERTQSVSIRHYDHFRHSPPRYQRHGLQVRRHNVVTARLRLGYRPLWQLCEAGDDRPHHSTCRLCDLPNANHLQHYCLECPSVRDLLPQGLSLIDMCKYLMTDDHLDNILVQHPHFGGC